MNWNSKNHRWEEYDDFDFSDYQPNKIKFMSGHNWRMIIGLVLIFAVGGLQALNNVGGMSAWATMILPVLLAAEHFLAGNTVTSTS